MTTTLELDSQCNCDVCLLTREVRDLCTRLSDSDGEIVWSLWGRMAIAEDDAAWERSKRGKIEAPVSHRIGGTAQGLKRLEGVPLWVEATLRIEAQLRSTDLETYVSQLLRLHAAGLGRRHNLLRARIALISVLKNKLAQLPNVLVNYSYGQRDREVSAETLVNLLFSDKE